MVIKGETPASLSQRGRETKPFFFLFILFIRDHYIYHHFVWSSSALFNLKLLIGQMIVGDLVVFWMDHPQPITLFQLITTQQKRNSIENSTTFFIQGLNSVSRFPIFQPKNTVPYIQTHACALPKSCLIFFEGPSQWTMLLSCKNVIQTLSILFITKKFQFHSNHSKSCGDNLHPLTAKALHKQ